VDWVLVEHQGPDLQPVLERSRRRGLRPKCKPVAARGNELAGSFAPIQPGCAGMRIESHAEASVPRWAGPPTRFGEHGRTGGILSLSRWMISTLVGQGLEEYSVVDTKPISSVDLPSEGACLKGNQDSECQIHRLPVGIDLHSL
jgi:hypothetical protein